MKLNTTRKTKTYNSGDEVTLLITESKEVNGNLSLKTVIVDGSNPTNVIIYHTVGDPTGKGVYYFDQLLNAIGVPEGVEIDENYFKGKRFNAILGKKEWQGKEYLTVGTFISANLEEEIDKLPFELPGESQDEDFGQKSEVKPKKGKLKNGNPDSPTRIDYTTLLDQNE